MSSWTGIDTKLTTKSGNFVFLHLLTMCEGTIVLTCIIIMNSVLCTHRDVYTLCTCTHAGANIQIASDT